MLKIGIIGAGKLGKSVIEEGRSSISIIYSSQTDLNIPTTQNLEEFLKNCDVIIDCSNAGLKARINQTNKPIIVATTKETECLKEINPQIPIMLAPNGSISWNIVQQAALNLAKSGNYHFSITDIHHKHKLDTPSGSARRLIEKLEETGAKVDCTSSRAFSSVGNHIIYAFNDDEMIKIEHQALSRNIFAKGLLKAANWIINQKPGLYYIEDMLK